jgi:hypothetical protein
MGLTEVKKALYSAMKKTTILTDKMPKKLFNLKSLLAKELEVESNIDKERYQTLAKEVNIEAQEELDSAIKVFDQLGVALHFKEIDPEWYVLDASWLSQTIYYLLNRSAKRDEGSFLSVEKLQVIFAEKDAPKVPSTKYRTLLNILVHFNLAYLHADGHRYRVPMIAPNDKPVFDYPSGEYVGFSTIMPRLLPEVLFYSFVTACGEEIVGDVIWKTGVYLSWGGSKSVVRLDRTARSIEIKVWGEESRRGAYLARLRFRLMALLQQSFQSLEYEAVLKHEAQEFVLRQFLFAIQKEQTMLMSKSGTMEVAIAELIQAVYGQQKLSEQIMEEMKLMQSKDPNIHINLENIGNTQISQTMVVQNIKLQQELVNLRSFVDELRYDIERKALKGTEYDKIQKDIARIDGLIREYIDIKAENEVAKIEKKSLLERIVNTANYIEKASQALDPIANTAKAIGSFIGKIKKVLDDGEG